MMYVYFTVGLIFFLNFKIYFGIYYLHFPCLIVFKIFRMKFYFFQTPFSNRDYVFKRRYHIDNDNKLVTLVNKSTEHPSCPAVPNKQRVKEYWSYMIIKPFDELDKV